MSLLDTIQGPADVKALTLDQCETLASEIRQRILAVTSRNGGHVGPNLGVVELTIAMHRVFDCPNDRFLFDVSHQGYVHKLLTGRNGEEFDRIRQTNGVSGFLSRSESLYDCYGAGHAGTALSAAVGMATARDLNGSNEHVVAVVGDAAFTCGITMEALNNITASTKRLIVILNDNEWSIAKNVGAISRYFNELITNPLYNRINDDIEAFLKHLPGGESLVKMGAKAKKEAKDFLVSSSLFEKFGLRYLGPIDGHDLPKLEQYLEFAQRAEQPILLHVITRKGKGYDVAIQQPEKFHGSSPFDLATGESQKPPAGTPPNWQNVFGQALVQQAKKDSRVVGITAAMPSGTSLNLLAKECPQQFFDVGIAEEHAVLFAAGLSTSGIKPVVAIYSTFLQRGLDPILHDICLQDLPVVFCMDRAGLSHNDGPTHHGLFDLSWLRCAPNAIIMQPRNEDELCDMLETALHTPHPTFIRYPRGSAEGVPVKSTPQVLPIGKAETLSQGNEVQLWALGNMVPVAQELADRLNAAGISTGVTNARFVKPLDEESLKQDYERVSLLVTLEDHVLMGGFGSAVLEAIHNLKLPFKPIERIGWPDCFIGHASSVDELRAAHGLDIESLFSRIQQQVALLQSSSVQ
jgi:1-deoxy-D-xylulose-5-phosphate synthase